MKTRCFFPLKLLNRPARARRLACWCLTGALLAGACAAPLASAAAADSAASSAAVAQAATIDIAAKAALLVDQKTGAILYAKNEHKELYPASLTKIMTALLVLEAVDDGKLTLDQQITATSTSMTGLDEDGSTAGIKAGEVMTVENLLYCMLVVSANEACAILAETVAGSVDDFVGMMNDKASELGCEDTHFMNPTGLQDSQHYTSAWDLYLIAKEAMTHKEFMKICDTAEVTIPATNLSPERNLHTTNYLLSGFRAAGYVDKDAHGVKTGSTSDAGHCLVSTATRGSMSLLSVVLGAEAVKLPTGKTQVQSFSETSRLFNWAFDNFAYQTVLKADDALAEVPVTLSREVNYVTVHPESDVEVLLPTGLKAEDLKRVIHLKNPSVEAPIAKGDVLGEVELSCGDTVYATAPLLAQNDVSASRMLTIWHDIQTFFDRTAVRVVGVILAVLLVLLAGWKITAGRRRYRHGQSMRRQSSYHGRRRRF